MSFQNSQMARSLSSQRRSAQSYVEVYDNDNLLSPILSESEPEEDDDGSLSSPQQNHQASVTQSLTECAHKLQIRPAIAVDFTPGKRDDLDLSDFEREERRCNIDGSDSDSDKADQVAKGPETEQDTTGVRAPDIERLVKSISQTSSDSDLDIQLSDRDSDSDSLSGIDIPVSSEFTVEIVGSPRQKTLREVIDTVDEAFSLDIDTGEDEPVSPPIEHPEQTQEPEVKKCEIPKRSKLPTLKKQNTGQLNQTSDIPGPAWHNKDTNPAFKEESKACTQSSNLAALPSVESSQSLAMSDPSIGSDDVFAPFSPPNGIDIFEPAPKANDLRPLAESPESRFEVVENSFRVKEAPELKKDDDDYCDSLEGNAAEDINDIEPPDALYDEDELKEEANALAMSIAKLSDKGDEEKKADERTGTPDSLEPELDALDDAASLRKPAHGPLGPPRCAQVKKPDIEAIRKKQGTFPKFKARPSPFKSKKPDKDKEKTENEENGENDESSEKLVKPEEKVEKKDTPPKQKIQAPKPKGRPPMIPPPSPRLALKRAASLGSRPSTEKHSQNGTAKLTSSSMTDHVDGDDPLADVLHSKVGEGLMANLLELGGEHGKDHTRRSSASGDSVASAGAESSATGVASLAPPAKRIVETKSSVKRRQAIIAKKAAPVEEESDDYLTPSQRKEKMMKDLKKELKNIQVALACKEVEMHDLLLNKEGESWERLKSKDEDNSRLRKEVVETKDLLSDMETKLTEMSEKLETRNRTIRELKEEMERREHANQEMYLKMYEKGQQSAMFERQDQLEKMAEEEPDSVSPSELLHKLEVTQKELIRWQALKRQESYDDAARPETPAEAKLNFLKDSMYHYLTDKETEGMHLRAMVGLLGFTEVQIRRIKNASKENKGRRASNK